MLDPDLSVFATIVREGSLSAAARRLGLSAAMVSRRLSRLEQRLGVELLRRTTRRLDLTSRGEQFYHDLTPALALLEDAEARVRDSAQIVAGPLRISAPTSFGRLHMAPLLAGFLKDHPRVSATLDLSDAQVALSAGRFDLAIRIASEIAPELDATRLATSRRLLCAAPDYLAAHGAPGTVDDLRQHPLLAAEGQLPWRLTGPEGDMLLPGQSHVRTNSSEVVRELVLCGAGIALRSLWDVADELASGRLVRILPDVEGSLDVGIFAVRPRTSVTPPAVTAFIDCVSDWLRPLPPWET